MELLGLDVGTLLLLCADRPSPAREVLLCAPYGGARLRGVPPQTLIETGLTAPELLKLGLDAEAVRAQTLASPPTSTRSGLRKKNSTRARVCVLGSFSIRLLRDAARV